MTVPASTTVPPEWVLAASRISVPAPRLMIRSVPEWTVESVCVCPVPTSTIVPPAPTRPGDPAFRRGFDACLRQIRYENYGDIVPLVPPSLTWFEKLVSGLIGGSHVARRLHDLLLRARDWNYVPVGEKLFITRHGTVTPGEPDMLQHLAVVAEVTDDLISGNFSSFARAHSLAPGGGYHLGVCGADADDGA
jgi:hypothetical protein